MPSNYLLNCRVCGLLQDEPPWGADGMCPNFIICSCCGVEFGYGDANDVGAKRWRARWLAGGAKWANLKEMPAGWDLERQLKLIPPAFRDTVE